jgi:hypothetical protein
VTVTARNPPPELTASPHDDYRQPLSTPAPLRSGTWPRQVGVDVARIENWLRIVLVGNACPHKSAVAEAIRGHLRDADTAVRRKPWYVEYSPVDWWRGSSIEQAYRSLHAARVFLVELIGDEEADALVPGVVARVQSCLPATDPQRIEIEKLPTTNDRKAKRAELIHALELGYEASDDAHTRIRRFRNILLAAAVLIGLFTFLFIREVADTPTAVPLCFTPAVTTAEAATLPAGTGTPARNRTVCPSAEQALGERPLTPSGTDVWIVAGLGLLGGGLASAVAVRKMVSSATPYDVPLALALLKVPTGALTSVAGILLLGGGFVPGFSELDSQRQILAYALVFGYAQQLATRYLDDRASSLLAEVPSKHASLQPTRSLPTAETAPRPAPPADNHQPRPDTAPASDDTSHPVRTGRP